MRTLLGLSENPNSSTVYSKPKIFLNISATFCQLLALRCLHATYRIIGACPRRLPNYPTSAVDSVGSIVRPFVGFALAVAFPASHYCFAGVAGKTKVTSKRSCDDRFHFYPSLVSRVLSASN
jgi:hypothetical protein